MPKRERVRIESSDTGDWVDIWVDGKAIYSNHAVGDEALHRVLEALDVPFTWVEVPGDD